MKKIFLMILLCISLCACAVEQTTSNDIEADVENKLLYQTIEITMDNFYDYFEEKEIVSVNYDDFDEVDWIEIQQYFALKEKYSIDTDASDVAIEYSVYSEEYYVDFDYETFQYTYEEKVEDEYDYKNILTKKDTFKNNYVNNGQQEEVIYGLNYWSHDPTSVVIDEETQRSKTTGRWFIEEIIRVKGTISIAEME